MNALKARDCFEIKTKIDTTCHATYGGIASLEYDVTGMSIATLLEVAWSLASNLPRHMMYHMNMTEFGEGTKAQTYPKDLAVMNLPSRDIYTFWYKCHGDVVY